MARSSAAKRKERTEDMHPVTERAARGIQLKLRKLSEAGNALKKGEHRNITCLTSIKSLCKEPDLARRFVRYLAHMSVNEMRRKGHPTINNCLNAP